MTALAAGRMTKRYGEQQFAKLQGYGVKANTKIWKGGLVVKEASGYAKPGVTATGLIALGVARDSVDNTVGAAANGSKFVTCDVGEFEFENSASADLIAIGDIGADCYIVDDQTVAKTDGTGTRSRAGKIINVTAAGKVVVRVGVGV
jgi:hypothetical protein